MSITPQEALTRTIEHREIFHDEMLHLMRMIMQGEVSPVMTAAIITGLRVKKESIGEIAAAAEVMRQFATPVHVANRQNFIDIVGTGGDGAHSFNISTTVMFVVRPPVAPSPSTATAASLPNPARPMSSKPWVPTSCSPPPRSLPASTSAASASCSPPTTTRP